MNRRPPVKRNASRSADLQSAVSQIFNLLAVGSQFGTLDGRQRSAEWNSAIQQTASLRYGSRSALVSLSILLVAWFVSFDPGVAAPRKPSRPPVAPGKPEIFEITPQGIQRGITARVKLTGTNLIGITDVILNSALLDGTVLDDPAPGTNEAWVEVKASAPLARGVYEISVRNTNSESSRLKLYVDDLPHAYEDPGSAKPQKLSLPVVFWGKLEQPGDADEIEFQARAGDSLVFDAAARSVGSKASLSLSLFGPGGRLVAANSGFDGADPLLGFKVPVTGLYRLRIGERTDAGSKEHFYRVAIGDFPLVVAVFPLAIPVHRESTLELIGFNLPTGLTQKITPEKPGELEVPIDLEKLRVRQPLKILANDGVERVETEPNDLPTSAMEMTVPSTVDGRIWTGTSGSTDVDLFRFQARAGQTLVVETEAARRGSPLDTRIEILDTGGKPVERLLLQAVRDSHVTFRGIDSNTDDLRVENWEEMELNQWMYLQGEVCRIFRMPQGPDSGFQFYSSQGKRRDYFDTSAVAHALDEAVYIVEPQPLGARLVPNGLPTFKLFYQNDDDAERKLGTDSRLLFTAPAEGAYLVRVTDARGTGGERAAYRLTVREANPDFKITLSGVNPAIAPGTGQEFTLSLERIDGFDGDVRVDITGAPAGVHVATPVVIQAGHLEARGTINADADATAPQTTNSIRLTAAATIAGREVKKDVNDFGQIKLGESPKLVVALEPYDEAATNFVDRSVNEHPLEITIAPGQTVPAWLKLKRNGHEDLVTFTVDGLPHGVIVDNIGLNGVLIPKDQDNRQIFLTAARWVPETDCYCFAQAKQAGNPTSLPVLLHVGKAGGEVSRSRPIEPH